MFTKSDAAFEHPAQGPHHCSQCVHYLRRGSCRIVAGIIEPGDWCKKFEMKDLALQREQIQKPMEPNHRKKKRVDIGEHSFTIKKPGDFRRRAQAAGKSTREYAREEKGASGKVGREARSALGLMAMAKRTRGKRK